MLWPLNRNKIFVFTVQTFKAEPIDCFVCLVFVTLDEVPSENEVLRDIVYTVSNDTHGDVVPRHATIIGFAEFVIAPVVDGLEIHDTVVVEVLAGEDFVLDTGGVDIGKGVRMSIPTSEAHIESSNEG